MRQRGGDGPRGEPGRGASDAATSSVGKRTLTESLPPAPPASAPAGAESLVLCEASEPSTEPTGPRPSDTAIAKMGFAGSASRFPNLPEVNAALGGDFSHVPVHTGAEAQAASRQLGANAYTHQGAVAFAPATPTAMRGNPIETKDAAQRWDAIPGNTSTGITF